MLYVQGNNLSYKYKDSDDLILDNISFFINSTSKVGVVGNNGCGKTTLFKIILNKADNHHDNDTIQGKIQFLKNKIKVGHLPQEILFHKEVYAEEYLWGNKEDLWKSKVIIDNYSQIETSDISFAETLNNFNELGGFDYETKIQKNLSRFKFCNSTLKREISTFSGGEKTRLALFKIFLHEPDVLLLDEPTNHLDMETLNWLEEYLNTTNTPFVIISHDRYFLDRCVNQIWELSNKKLKTYSGDYSDYKTEKEIEFEQQKEKFLIQQKKIKQLETAVQQRRKLADAQEKFKPKRSIKKNGGICKRDMFGVSLRSEQSMMKSAVAVEKRINLMIEKEKAQMPFIEKKKNVFIKCDKQSNSKIIISLQNVSKQFDRNIFTNLNLDIKTGSKLAIIGKNGKGKSTLLNIIASQDKDFSGVCKISPSATIAYYSQSFIAPNDISSSIFDELIKDNNQTQVRNFLGALGIKDKKIFQTITTLSMGERSKVSLVKTLLMKTNVLLLDEPTNHLEISSKEALEKAIIEYNGTVVFTTHDRYFLKNVATDVFDLETMAFINIDVV